MRQENMPPIPRRVEDVRVEDEWARTWNGRHFLSLRDNVAGVLIFITVTRLDMLSGVRIPQCKNRLVYQETCQLVSSTFSIRKLGHLVNFAIDRIHFIEHPIAH